MEDNNYLYYIFGTLFIIGLFFEIKGKFRLNKILNEWSNKLNNSHWDEVLQTNIKEEKTLLKDWNLLKINVTEHNRKINTLVFNLDEEIQILENNSQIKNLNFKENIFNHIFCEEYKIIKYYQYKNKLNYLNKIRKNLIKTLVDNQESYETKDNHYYNNDEIYQKICNIYQKQYSIKNQYEIVLSSISSARSAISNAELAETMDLLSKNKGISLMSSVSSSGANSSIKKVKREVVNLSNMINELKDFQNSITNVDDTFDLMIDLFFDTGFDFFSVFNLFSLGNAKSSLSKV